MKKNETDMLTLNLAYPHKSNILFKIDRFPDGQQQVRLEGLEIERMKNSYSSNYDVNIFIKSRLNNFQDLELICCSVASLTELGIKNIHLYTPYFLGSRSDRKFEEASNNYLKKVICPIINSLNFQSVTVWDPHSDVLEACLNNFKKINNLALVDDALSYLIKDEEEDQIVLVSPDAGSYKKIFDVAMNFGIKKIITASKARDLKTGEILQTVIPELNQDNNLKYVIVDDICDGGRTFIELAKGIKSSRPTAEIYLIVTHGIFSGGFYSLNEVLDGIFCTNSYEDIESKKHDDKGSTTNSRGSSVTKPYFVKQLNIF